MPITKIINWISKNIVGELPVIGFYFQEQDRAKASSLAVKCVSSLIGGASAMVAFDVQHGKTVAESAYDTAMMGGIMLGGMTAGKVLYNVGTEMLFCYRVEPEAKSNGQLDETASLRSNDETVSLRFNGPEGPALA